jgi:hypothetical protein
MHFQFMNLIYYTVVVKCPQKNVILYFQQFIPQLVEICLWIFAFLCSCCKMCINDDRILQAPLLCILLYPAVMLKLSYSYLHVWGWVEILKDIF